VLDETGWVRAIEGRQKKNYAEVARPGRGNAEREVREEKGGGEIPRPAKRPGAQMRCANPREINGAKEKNRSLARDDISLGRGRRGTWGGLGWNATLRTRGNVERQNTRAQTGVVCCHRELQRRER